MTFEFLDSLDLMITFSVVILLLANLILLKKFNSVVITVLAYLMVQGLSFAFIELVRDSSDILSPGITRIVWYFGFAFVDLLAVVVICKLHRALNEIYSIAARSTVTVLMFFAVLQVVNFFDRQYGSDILAGFYSWAIPIGNMAVLTLLSVATVTTVLQRNGYSGVKGI